MTYKSQPFPQVAIAVVSVVISVLSVSPWAAKAEKAREKQAIGDSAKSKEILLPFPNERGYGTISKVTREDELETAAKRTPLGEAKGTIKLPAGTIVFYEPGPRFFQNPQVLKKFAPDSIKYIKMQFTAMDDSEDKMSDRAIDYLRLLTGLRAINLDKSDTSDKGIASLAGMPNLRAVSATETMVNGACLKSLSTCQSLVMVRFGAIQVDNDSLRYLKDFKTLKRLVLSRCGVNSQGVQNISACPSITQLDISNNPKIGDKDLLKLRTLKKLEYVNLRGTTATIAGVNTFIRGCKAKLVMPKMFAQYTKAEQSEIKKVTGHIVFDFDHNLQDPDYKTIFGTVNRK